MQHGSKSNTKLGTKTDFFNCFLICIIVPHSRAVYCLCMFWGMIFVKIMCARIAPFKKQCHPVLFLHHVSFTIHFGHILTTFWGPNPPTWNFPFSLFDHMCGPCPLLCAPFLNKYQKLYPKLVQHLRKHLNIVTITVHISTKPSISLCFAVPCEGGRRHERSH